MLFSLHARLRVRLSARSSLRPLSFEGHMDSAKPGQVLPRGGGGVAATRGIVEWAKRSVPTIVSHDMGRYGELSSHYRTACERRPFETIAICVLPDHMHALWALPED